MFYCHILSTLSKTFVKYIPVLNIHFVRAWHKGVGKKRLFRSNKLCKQFDIQMYSVAQLANRWHSIQCLFYCMHSVHSINNEIAIAEHMRTQFACLVDTGEHRRSTIHVFDSATECKIIVYIQLSYVGYMYYLS